MFSGIGRIAACSLLAAASLSVLLLPAHAHKRDFAFTYDWNTPAKGEKEIEVWNTYADEGHAYQGQAEFEAGLTDHLSLGVYYVHESAQGEGSRNGVKVETRYRFGEYEEGKILPAAYLEYEDMSSEPYEIEAKAIFSRFTNGTNLSLNLITSKAHESGAERESGYALGYAVQSRQPTLRFGVEAIGSFKDNVHAVGPVVAYDLNMASRLVLGTSIPITRDATSQVRLVFEYEFF